MSTKTTFKRIALVAVAALGFGVLTSVSPATAVGTNDNIDAISAGTSAPARVGVSSGATTITLTHPETATPGYIDTVTAQITSAPALSTAAVLTFSAATSKPFTSATYTASSSTNWAAASEAGIAKARGALDVGKTTNVVLSLNADIAGTYTILVTANATPGGGFTAGKKSTSYTITTAGAPTALTLASVAGAVTSTGSHGQLLSLSMKDAAGNATVLGLNESIDITDNTTLAGIYKPLPTDASIGSIATALGSGDTAIAGVYYLRAVQTGTVATGTGIVTLTGGGLLPATLTVNGTITLTATSANPTAASTVACTTAANCTGGTASGNQSLTTSGAQSLTFTNAAAVGNATATSALATVYNVEVINSSGFRYSSTASVAAAATALKTATFTAPAPSATGTTSVTLHGVTAVMTLGAPAASKITVLGSTSVLSATAGSTTWNVEVDDQYGNAIQFAPVSVSVAGRNTVATTALGVTDANGIISYTLKDAGTTGTRDTLTFTTVTGVTAATATVTYGTVTVAKVSFTGPNTAAGVAATTTTVSPISAGDTPEASTAAASVVVTDAAGNLLAGVPVAFTVSGTTAAITSNAVTVYTDSAGKAASTVFAWVAGTYTVTATAGGITGTGSYTFANSNAADARVLSATATEGMITAKVVDRFGNPVSGVSVFVSRTSGSGYFGTGVSKTTSTTGLDGTVEFILVGTGNVLVSTLSYDAVAGTNAAGQTCALAGNLTCAVGATAAKAFTATTAGTAAVAGKNIGSSFAPAGVSSVTLAVNNNAAADSATAAADAAAEATDAANAATDAANAAAEAADAATAAAQDAADAVAALSTQVTEMVNALKKQITALTNLVIKIQKKVRA